MKLFYRQAGQGPPLIILHGLFGSSDNWFTLAKTFAQQYQVWLLDQRNHGQSFHHPEFNYRVLTEDLEKFIAGHNIQQPTLLGHSMGGKTAMNFAVKNPGQVKNLVVVDIMPKSYPVHHDYILEGLQAVKQAALPSRAAADELLARHIPQADVRQFLLKNLARNADGRLTWRINLDAIDRNIESVGAGMLYDGAYAGPTLFVNGARSDYYRPGDEQTARQYFPASAWAQLDTGHWVHAEKPEEFADTVFRFLSSPA
jgi:pimeloyl-ACP methyl ester carboxylesterase